MFDFDVLALRLVHLFLGPNMVLLVMEKTGDEISFEMESSDDAKTVTLTLKSTCEMTVSDLILALETYLTDLVRAEDQRRKPGILSH